MNTDDSPLGLFIGLLVFLLFLSAYFSSSETATRNLNRYRLKHLKRTGHAGAKTLNGLLMEILESIPDSAVCVILNNYYAEILQVKDNMIRTVRMWEIKSDKDPQSGITKD